MVSGPNFAPMPSLYLLPNTLGHDDADLLPAIVHQQLRALNRFAVESPKAARRLLKTVGRNAPYDEIEMRVLDEHSSKAEIEELGQWLKLGDTGLMTDAGCPGIADPGASLVEMAHRNGIEVVPLPGPSSILLTLMASGMGGQRFTFNGYLPGREPDRTRVIRELMEAAKKGYTQLFMETPYRNLAMFESLINALPANALLTIGCALTHPGGWVRTRRAEGWRKDPPNLKGLPTVYAIGG